MPKLKLFRTIELSLMSTKKSFFFLRRIDFFYLFIGYNTKDFKHTTKNYRGYEFM